MVVAYLNYLDVSCLLSYYTQLSLCLQVELARYLAFSVFIYLKDNFV